MQVEMKNIFTLFFGLVAVIAFTSIFVIYGNDSLAFVLIFICHYALYRILWSQPFHKKRTLLLWILMSIGIIFAVFLRDRTVVYFGQEEWYHSTSYYVYVGLASALWWSMLGLLASKKKGEENSKSQAS